MKTQLEFKSEAFPPLPGEEEKINPGRFGKNLADFIAAELPKHGFTVNLVDFEDWGLRIEIENKTFPLWIGCGNYDDEDNGFHCFIEPAKPFIRKWLPKIETTLVVSRLASALESILLNSGKVSDLHWIVDDEPP